MDRGQLLALMTRGMGLEGALALLSACNASAGGEASPSADAGLAGVEPCHGRPLREDDAPLLPELLGEQGLGTAAGRAYREFARAEQASVAAFSYCARVLEELGAPAELVARNRVAACEEAEHARLALRAAAALDGVQAALGPTPAPQRPPDLEDFVRHLAIDACLGEAGAACEAHWARRQPEVRTWPELRRFWATVEREEAGHAALAWETLEFLLTRVRGLAPTLRAALRAGLRVGAPHAAARPRAGRGSPQARRVYPRDPSVTALERFGVASPQTRAAIFARVGDDLAWASAWRVARAGAHLAGPRNAEAKRDERVALRELDA